MKEYSIAVFGSFDVKNYGDLLFPNVLKYQLEKRMKIKNFVMFSPNGGIKPFEENIVYSIRSLPIINKKYKFDAFIIGGGDVIRIDKAVAPSYKKNYDASILMWQYPIMFAKENNIPILFNCPGVPFLFDNKKNIVHDLLSEVEYLSVRDNYAKKNLKNCNLSSVNVVPDSILSIGELYNKKDLKNNFDKLIEKGVIPKMNKFIVIHHNNFNRQNKKYINEINKLIEYINNVEGIDVILMPIGYVHNDIMFLNMLTQNKKTILLKSELSPYDMLSIIACSKGYIGTSLHGAITATAYKKPILTINCQKFAKISGFMEIIGKKKLEIQDINKLCITYKKSFNEQKFDKYNYAIKRIDNHFEKISNFIQNSSKKSIESKMFDKVFNTVYGDYDFYTEKINSLFDFEKCFPTFTLFYSEDENFTQENSKKIKFTKNNTYNIKIKISSKYKYLRLDPIEGRYIKINNIELKNNNKIVEYRIPNSIIIDGNIYIYIVKIHKYYF